MRKFGFTLTSLLALGASAAAAQNFTPYNEMPAGVYGLDNTHASLTWKVSHFGLADYTARFTDFDVELDFNPEDPTKSSLNVTVDPASVRTDYPTPEKEDFDKKLSKGADWFNAGEFPKITFTSTSIKMTGEDTGEVTGDLTFLGVTKPATLDVTFNGAYAEKPFAGVPALGFSATGTIKRSDWGFDTYVPAIGDEVDLVIEVELQQ